MTRHSHSDLRIKALRLGFQTLRALSTDLAHRGAEHLFSSPRRHREPEAERCARQRGRVFHFMSKGLRLRGHAWGEGPAILCLHGWEGRGTQFQAFIEPLTKAGFSILTFDQPGHGGSQGRRSGPLQWAQATRDLVAQVGPIHGLVAHSLGAAGAAIAMDHGLQAPRAVFLAPPARPDPYYDRVLSLLGFPDAEHPAAFQAYARRTGLPPERIRLLSLASRLSTPLLVIHDRGDREVPWSDGEAIASAWPSATLLTTEGLGHQRILRDPAVIEQTVAFLQRAEAPHPLPFPLPFHGEGPRSLEWHLFHRDLRRYGRT
ncbi:MAG TPA: alpha/beta fold hydrolase [Geothrix sp.]|uniref:alpha/beta hydrolase n=1 Tax=Geothrix mesophila TaxID=2922723 RepID=UPI001FADD496|nr:alpha/beta fold hydrolase [Geothrix sp. SG198]HJV39915.1 alpha/beta fold hydrolase [Geothrix sp.]